MALFISHLNPHAAAITTPTVRRGNRLFATFGVAGLASLATLTTWAAVRLRLPLQVAVLVPYLGAHLGGSLVFHVEARYGLPLIPPAIVALVLLARAALTAGWTRRIAILAGIAAVSGVFVAQTTAWDRDDPGMQPTSFDPAAVFEQVPSIPLPRPRW